MMWSLAASAAVLALAPAAPAAAQTADAPLRPFCPDRPGKGDSTCVMDQGHVQVEVGLFDTARQDDDATRAESWAAGTVVVRYGVGPSTEVQAGFSTWQRDKVTDRSTGLTQRAEGLGDLFLAVRHGFVRPDGGGTGLAVTAFATLPTGGEEVRVSGVEGGLALPVAVDLGGDWGLGVSPIVEYVRDGDGEGSHGAWSLVVGLGRPVGDWSLGAEVWVSRDDDPLGASTQATFDLLAAWSPPFMTDAQLDFGLNLGLNDDSPDLEFGIGIARRF
ncbi:MAG TPA: transporter [Brevundimonas sp.]|jgi:hypothetical protein